MIKRLTKDDFLSWELYPFFQARVEKFASKYDISCPIEPILAEMRQRWVGASDLAGYFVAVEEADISAHFVSWITNNYGQNKLYIYQAEADKNADNFRQLWPEVRNWIVGLNSQVEAKLQVHKFELCTWHDSETWIRYFRHLGIESVELRRVLGGCII